MAKTKTSIEALVERTTATGFVVLDSMATVLLEMALAEAEVDTMLPATLPKAQDYAFWKRCKVVEKIYARVGR
jgi:hypothetical protein